MTLHVSVLFASVFTVNMSEKPVCGFPLCKCLFFDVLTGKNIAVDRKYDITFREKKLSIAVKYARGHIIELLGYFNLAYVHMLLSKH